MFKFCRFSAFVAFALCGFAVAGNADTFSLGSYAGANPGFDNTETTYEPVISTMNTGSASTYDVSAGTVWHSALGSSSYVSFNPNTGAALTYDAPDGDYYYTTTFITGSKVSTGEGLTGTMTVLADDTVAVYLNGVMILDSAGPMGADNSYSHCSDVGPGCLTPLTFTFGGILDGVNVLTFDVKQVNGSNEGLDYVATIASDPVPEPSSLALLSTGMVGMAFLLRHVANAK